MGWQFSNFARTKLTSAVETFSNEIQIEDGSRFPDSGERNGYGGFDNSFVVVVQDDDGFEVMDVARDATNAPNTLYAISRGLGIFESTKNEFAAGATVAQRVTAEIMRSLFFTLGQVQDNVDGFYDWAVDIHGNVKSAAYTLALTDRGKSIDTTAGVTVPANATVALPTGATVMVTNTGFAAITITAAAGVTLRLAGTTTTGNRTLAGYGVATLRKVATDTWIAAGAGLS